MAHFARTRAGGFWTLTSTLLSSEMEDLDAKLYKAINGDEGGAWTPTDPIEIGGDGLSLGGATGHRVLSGSALYANSGGAITWSSGSTLDVASSVTVQFASAIVATAGGTLSGTWAMGGATNITSSGTLTIQNGGDLTSAVGSNVALLFDQGTSGATFQNSAFCNFYTGTTLTADAGSTATFNGAVVLAGATTLSGAMTCTEPITLSSNGTIKWRAYLGTDANVTILADAYDEVHVVASTPTADRTYTLAGTAVEGQRFHISYKGASYKITLSYNGGGDSFEVKNASTKYTHATLTYISGSWRLTNYMLVPLAGRPRGGVRAAQQRAFRGLAERANVRARSRLLDVRVAHRGRRRRSALRPTHEHPGARATRRARRHPASARARASRAWPIGRVRVAARERQGAANHHRSQQESHSRRA